MKNVFNLALVLAFLALDWAAMHDILAGEADQYLEYMTLIVSLLVFGYVGLTTFKKKSA